MPNSPNYFDLTSEESWVDYVKTRLPYSFRRTERKEENKDGKSKYVYYRLSEPTLVKGTLAAEYHNFWKRGNVSYMAGKLIDQHSMSTLWKAHKDLRTNQIWSKVGVGPQFPTIFPRDTYNSMQMEKLWRFMQDNILDRERVVMMNVFHALELCLKAVMCHTRFRLCKEFTFDEGHDIVELYEALPDQIKDEIATESIVFVEDYLALRKQVEADMERLTDFFFRDVGKPSAAQPYRTDWERITERVDSISYTAFVNANDPIPDENWFTEALDRLTRVKGIDRGTYFRYAPLKDKDELPTDLIHSGLLLGRFMYEHLFPVPLDSDYLA